MPLRNRSSLRSADALPSRPVFRPNPSRRLHAGSASRAKSIFLHARGLEHQSKGVENCLAVINIALATGNLGHEGAGPTMITGQGNGQGGREHGQKCDQLPGQRHSPIPPRASTLRGSGESRPTNFRSPATPPTRSWRRSTGARSRLCCRYVSTRWCRCPTLISPARRCRNLEFFGVIDFFLSETAHHADVVLAGSLHEEEDGLGCSAEGRVITWQSSWIRPANARRDSGHHCRSGTAPRQSSSSFPSKNRARSSKNCAQASRGGVADYYGITYEKIERDEGVFWPCPTLDHPGNAATLRRHEVLTPNDQKAHFQVTQWRPSATPSTTNNPIYLTTGRVVSQYLSGTQTRRIGALVDQYPEPRVEIHPRLAQQYGIATATG